MTNETLQTYNHIASQYSETHFEHFWIKEFDRFKELVPGQKIVDIGCGAGRDAAVFVKEGFDYTGIDASEGMLEVAKRRVPRGSFQQMSYYDLSLPKNSFDGFWAAASLLHAPKKKIPDVLTSLKTLLKTHGAGFITVKEKQGKVEELLKKEGKYGGKGRYFAYYTKEEFRELLQGAGFTLEDFWARPEDDDKKTSWLCYFVRKS